MKASLIIGIVIAATLSLDSPVGNAKLSTGFSAQKASFAVKFKDEVSNYRVNGVFVMPGDEFIVGIDQAVNGHVYQMSAGSGAWQMIGPTQWKWKAPMAAGVDNVTLLDCNSQESILLNIFVMVPASKIRDGQLNGYKIGQYPSHPLNHSEIYIPPKGFIEVTEENRNTLVSPHFKIGQFICKQEGHYPKYVLVRERLLYKLESLLEEVNSYGYRAETLTVMSGFRTPYYNHVLRNVAYSRHMWGDAADIFIDDQPHDNLMDDLNGDGRHDVRDSKMLGRMVNDLVNHPGNEKFVGGLGVYKPTSSHGPFVHVDTRGKKASW